MAARPPVPAPIYALDLGPSVGSPVLCLDCCAYPRSSLDINTRPTQHDPVSALVLLWVGCQLRAHCIDQLLITMPFYASAAYSLGALLARNTLNKIGQNLQFL